MRRPAARALALPERSRRRRRTGAAHVIGNTLRLTATGRAYQLNGYDSRGACRSLLRSPDGRYVIYGNSRGAWPALDLLDLSTGARSVFHTHACDPAWGRDGQIAYVRDDSLDASAGVYRGRILVQHGLSGTSSVWSGEADWGNPVWAGADLLANDGVLPDGPDPLVILDGPGRQRSVDGPPRALGPLSTVVAVNPQGTEALLDTQRLGRTGSTSSEDVATLLRIADDQVLSTAVVDNEEARNSNLVALAPRGSWLGDEVVTTDGIFNGGSSHPPATFVTLTVHANRVRLRSAKPLLERGYLPLAQSLVELSEARFLDSSGRHVAFWLDAIGQLKYIACDAVTGRCNTSRNYGDPLGNPVTDATFVSNPGSP
jgi:hypothetical protein